MFRTILFAAGLCLTPGNVAWGQTNELTPLLKTHCVKCHGPEKRSGGIRLDDLPADPRNDVRRWSVIRDQIRDGLMPPAKEPRLDSARARAAVAWVTARVGVTARLPNEGNLIPHELLFGKPAATGKASTARVWRLSPNGYMGFVREVLRGKNITGLVQPFTLIPERGIKDFAGLYTIDEPSTEILLRNAEAIVEVQTGHDLQGGKVKGRSSAIAEFVALMGPGAEPTRKQLESAIQTQFRLAIGRSARSDETDRLIALYEKCAKADDRPAAVRTMLQAVLLHTDALFRNELGRGKANGAGRRLLAPAELARAISLALGDRREAGLVQAAAKNELTTREQVVAHVRRILDDAKIEKPRLLRFFREYFEHGNAVNVFKDKPSAFQHEPAILVSDTDRLIEHILGEDRDVFRRLLTTPVSFVNYTLRRNKKTRKMEPARAAIPPPVNRKRKNEKPVLGVESVYGVADWPANQPVALPRNTRLGVLMQPSWLIAFSTNFENDPVRRGRWVRERLLGGTVPDLPIGVAAQVPDEPHRPLRDRLTITRDAKCWKCHQRMDDLGLPFENFDHFGRFRTTETVRDLEATARNVDSKGKPLGPMTREVRLSTTGRIADSGDPKLNGLLESPRDLVRKLAGSERVRQVFVRHVFRYYLGRNETLSDARTLQNADRAYVESGGSFKALLVSLLASDAFLYRIPASPSQPPAGDRK